MLIIKTFRGKVVPPMMLVDSDEIGFGPVGLGKPQ